MGIGRRRAAAVPVVTEIATAKPGTAKKGGKLSGVGEMRVLQIEALGFQIAELGFDDPSLTIKKACSSPGDFATASAKSRNSD